MNDETNLSGVQNAPVLPERQSEGQNHVEQTRIPSFFNQPINAPIVPPVVAQETEIEEPEESELLVSWLLLLTAGVLLLVGCSLLHADNPATQAIAVTQLSNATKNRFIFFIKLLHL